MLKHRKMLLCSIGMIVAGLILWLLLGPLILLFGIGSYSTGWWIFTETHYFLTPMGYLGLGLSISGLIIFIVGIAMVIVVIILEVTDRKVSQP